jgi:hypothetical protein
MKVLLIHTIALILAAASAAFAQAPARANRQTDARTDGSDIRMIDDGNDRFGYINQAGKVIVEPQFTDADEFFEGLARVQRDGKWGFIDHSGRFVIPLIYDCADNFSEGLARVTRGGKYGYIDATGRIAVPLTLAAVDVRQAPIFRSGLAPAPGPDGELFGYIDRRGHMVIAPRFVDAHPFSEELACVTVQTHAGRKTGYIDVKGRMVIAAEFDSGDEFAGGLARVRIGDWETGTYRYIDRTGRVAVDPKSGEVNPFSDGLAAVGTGGRVIINWLTVDVESMCVNNRHGGVAGVVGVLSPGKIGFIDTTGKYVIEPTYPYAGMFSEGLAPVQLAAGWGYIDKTGSIVIAPQFEIAGSFFRGLAQVRLSGWRTAMIDRTGRVVWSAS